jgi:hypothetical protein
VRRAPNEKPRRTAGLPFTGVESELAVLALLALTTLLPRLVAALLLLAGFLTAALLLATLLAGLIALLLLTRFLIGILVLLAHCRSSKSCLAF